MLSGVTSWLGSEARIRSSREPAQIQFIAPRALQFVLSSSLGKSELENRPENQAENRFQGGSLI